MSVLQRVSTAFKVRVDELEFSIVSGSLEFKEGDPTREVKGQDDGTIVYSENYEEAKGYIKFEVMATEDNINKARQVEKRQAVTVIFSDDNGLEKVMRSGVSLNASNSMFLNFAIEGCSFRASFTMFSSVAL